MKQEQEYRMAEEEKEQGGLFHHKERLIKVIVAAGLIGIALIFLSGLFQKDQGQNEPVKGQDDALMIERAERYKQQLTDELGNMIASIEGAGRTKLMLTLDSTVQYSYAADSDIKTDDKNAADEHQSDEKRSYLVIKNQSGAEQALSLGGMMPAVRGVLVVCEGGDRKEVAQAVCSAVSAAVHIPESRVCVLKMSVQ